MLPMHAMNYIKNLPKTLLNDAIDELGIKGRLECKIFVEDIDENDNYMYAVRLATSAN